ncbi:hypothetical protein MKZ38_002315 [Zalerion maritima]|uniref:Uncharacterized protein n=1 Tax=Zalerion maritima TaxID=339359 RepID=A0AAD5RQG8_9PEZI|nr:hypothetical protein MKZ38_002315 [Zalerion maritima]
MPSRQDAASRGPAAEPALGKTGAILPPPPPPRPQLPGVKRPALDDHPSDQGITPHNLIEIFQTLILESRRVPRVLALMGALGGFEWLCMHHLAAYLAGLVPMRN